jgi:hypothetical protein
MFNHSLIFLALLSFSIAAQAAAIPMDAGQAVSGAIQHADTHQDVMQAQGGKPDKDVANDHAFACPPDTQCDSATTSVDATKPPVASGWLLVSESSSALQPIAVLLLIIGLIVFFLSRKSASTK